MISINFNPSVLTTQRNLNIATSSLNSALERMSTGYKINLAADDAAGMCVSSSLNIKIRGLSQAQKNLADGISLIQTADGSLSNMSDILNRLRDLAVQWANGVYDSSSLSAMQSEANSLTAQLNQVKDGTIFNGLSVFDGSATPPPNGSNGSGGAVSGDFINSVTRLSEDEAIAQGYTLIKTADDLNNIRNNLSGKYILMNDIDLSSYANWDPIGDLTSDTGFTGTLDGNGYVVKNLTINRPTEDGVGLFVLIGDGNTMSGGEVKNLGLENVNVEGNGGAAGLASMSVGNITNCYIIGDISGKDYIGGLVGQNLGTISNTFTTGTVIASGSSVGGLVGSNLGLITDCNSKCSVTGTIYTGGLVGMSGTLGMPVTNTVSIINSYSTGTVKGDMVTGGLVGYIDEGIVTNSYSTSLIKGSKDVAGGLAGYLINGTISNSYATGLVQGTTNVGGLVGLSDTNAKIENSIWNTQTTGQSVGIGDNQGGTDTNNKGLTTSQMKDPTNWTGWDDTIWDFSSYPPKLKGQSNSQSNDNSQNAIRLQIGEDEKSTSCIYLETYFSLDGFSVDFSTSESCASAIDDIDELLSKINEKRADFGAVLNRLSSISDSQVTAIENCTGAKSTIMDADIAEESANFVKSQILQQTSTVLLTQSQSTQSSLVLSLLQ